MMADIKEQLQKTYNKCSIAYSRGYEADELEWDMDLGTYICMRDYMVKTMCLGLKENLSGKVVSLWGIPIHERTNCDTHFDLVIKGEW